MFILYTGIIKKLLKTIQNKKRGIVRQSLRARSKSDSIETLIHQALIHSNISHEKCTTIISEEVKYKRMKEDVRMTKGQRSDAEKNELNEESKKIKINKIIRQNNENA